MSSTLEALGVTVLERGWLSSNSTVVSDSHGGHVVDTGYCTHADQTVALVQRVLQGRPLREILNTHLHSDHCGGNAALKHAYPDALISIPPGQATAVSAWDEVLLTYKPTGQQCDRFGYDRLLRPNTEVVLAGHAWQIHAAPGHDPHAILLYQPDQGVLISGDALWEHGFGVVFPELEGESAFDEVEATLHLIENLEPRLVIPGHGTPFIGVGPALARARTRLDQFRSAPARHSEYAAKVLVKFRLLQCQQTSIEELTNWFDSTPYFGLVRRQSGTTDLTLPYLLERLVGSGAARLEGDRVFDA